MLLDNFTLYLLIGFALFLSLTINLLFIFRDLAEKYPSVFYEEIED